MDFILFLSLPNLIAPRSMGITPPPASDSVRTTPLYHYLTRMHVFGWLLHLNISNGGCQRPQCNFFCLFFDAPFDCKNNGTAPPTLVQPWPCALTNTPPTEYANFWLVVVFFQPDGSPSRPRCNIYIHFFLMLHLIVKTMGPRPPTRSAPAACPHRHLSYWDGKFWLVVVFDVRTAAT
jgi:hypothetical protein